MLSLLRLSFLPANKDFGLLLLRLSLGGSLACLHGWGKMQKFLSGSDEFMPVLFNARISLGLAAFAELVCAALVVLGLFTRLASVFVIATMAVAFFQVHKMKLSGDGSGELALVYLAGFVAIFFAGAGKLSLDRE